MLICFGLVLRIFSILTLKIILNISEKHPFRRINLYNWQTPKNIDELKIRFVFSNRFLDFVHPFFEFQKFLLSELKWIFSSKADFHDSNTYPQPLREGSDRA